MSWINKQTGNYTIQPQDCNKLVVFNSASNISCSLPTATSFQSGGTFEFAVSNIGAGTVTITPVTSKIDGISSLALATDTGVIIRTDGTDYFTVRGVGSSSSSSSGLFGPVMQAPSLTSWGLNTTFNQNATFSSSTTSSGVLFADTGGGAGEHMEGLVTSWPGTAFTATMLLSMATYSPGNGADTAGFVLLTSLTGTAMMFGMRWAGLWQWAVMKYNSPTSYNSYALNPFDGSIKSPFWLKLQYDGTNLKFSISSDGVYWQVIYTVALASAWVTAPTYWGVQLNPLSGPEGITVLSWNYTTP